MMKRWMLVVLAVLTVSMSAFATEESTEDPRENACYAGGTLESKCDWPTEAETEWAWNCGWYWAAYQGGRAAGENLPETCKIWAAPIVEPIDPIEPIEPIEPVLTCYYSIGEPERPDFQLVGPISTESNMLIFNSSDGSCSGGEAGYNLLMEAPDSLTALLACIDINPAYNISFNVSFFYVNAPANWWRCYVI